MNAFYWKPSFQQSSYEIILLSSLIPQDSHVVHVNSSGSYFFNVHTAWIDVGGTVVFQRPALNFFEVIISMITQYVTKR